MYRTIAVLIALTIQSPLFAWNKAGHMVSGAIAYAVLKQDNQEVLANALQLLKAHPQFAEHWSKRLDDAIATIPIPCTHIPLAINHLRPNLSERAPVTS